MKVILTKDFRKVMHKQSGKMLDSIRRAVQEAQDARSLSDITDIKKIVGLHTIYRKRIGSMRAFLTINIEIVDDTVIFRYLVNRGEAYSKEMMQKLSNIDNPAK